MTLEARLSALATAIGADVKDLRATAGTPGPQGPAGPAGPVGNASALVRATTAYTTAVLADGASETGFVSIAPSYELLRIQTNVPARIRLYASTAQRDADVARLVTVDPTGDHGVIFEFVTLASDLDWAITPMADGYRLDSISSSIPISVTNLSGSSGAVTVTLTYIPLEGTAGALQGPVGPAGSNLAMTTYVTALPGSPVDGQEVYFRVADGVVWHLRYKAAITDAYKWEFLGGAPMLSLSNGVTSNITVINTWQDGSNGAVSLTAPLSGIYDVAYGCAHAQPDQSSEVVDLGISIAGAAPVGGNGQPSVYSQTGASMRASMRGETRPTVAANAVVKIQQRSTGLNSAWRDRYLTMKPTRVG
jgi:hypothetical protein